MNPHPANTARFGRLIGISLGPGDPELVTRRGWAALQSGARWAYPVKKAAERSYALDIARRGGLDIPQDAVELVFPMTRDAEALAKAWARAAVQTVELLGAGRDLVFLVEGDASTYSTFRHLARTVRELAPEVEVDTIPGVSSFAAAAAVADLALAEEDETMAVIPAAYGTDAIDRLLPEFDTLVLMKVKPLLDSLIAWLQTRGLLEQALFIERVGAPDERSFAGPEMLQLLGTKVSYLSLLLVRNPQRVRGERIKGCLKTMRLGGCSRGP